MEFYQCKPYSYVWSRFVSISMFSCQFILVVIDRQHHDTFEVEVVVVRVSRTRGHPPSGSISRCVIESIRAQVVAMQGKTKDNHQ
jgi:hypothetical protein